MTTGTKIIKLAFRQIGVDSPQMPVNPESLDDAFDILNAMVAEWQDAGMTMATVPLSVIGDDLSEPLGTKLSFVYNLAIRLAPAFDVAASNELSKNAMISYGAMERQWNTTTAPKRQMRGTMPKGQGNETYNYWNNTFYTEGEEIG